MGTASKPTLEGKVILLTGATSGIGKVAARAFAQMSATLVLVGRDAIKTEKIATELSRETGNAQIEWLAGDLSRLDDVRAIASAFKSRHQRLDVLVNNAGAIFASKELSADGFERTFALNHLSSFLLTHELLELLARTPGARVVCTASGSHRRGRLADLDETAKRNRGYSSWAAYADSKLANVLFTRELARRVREAGILASCFHPGFVDTGFGQNNAGTLLAVAVRLGMSLFGRSPKKGADTLVWLAASETAALPSGAYFHDRRVSRIARSLPWLLVAALVLVGATLGRALAVDLHLPMVVGELALGIVFARVASRGLPLSASTADQLARRLWSFSETACGITPAS